MQESMKLRDVVYKSPNLIVQRIQKGSNASNSAVIVGNGHSVSVDDNDNVTFTDPGYRPVKSIKGYGDKCSVFIIYYPTTCEGLAASGKELAEFINTDFKLYKKIILHGHSKCGVCFINLAQWLDEWTSYRTSIVSVSAPLGGTPIADIESFSKGLNRIEKFFYLKFFSDHKVDRDICPGSKFLNNLDSLPFDHPRIEFVISKCGISINPIDWVLWFIGVKAGIKGDGFVSLSSQIPNWPHTPITASHATSLRKSCKYVRDMIP